MKAAIVIMKIICKTQIQSLYKILQYKVINYCSKTLEAAVCCPRWVQGLKFNFLMIRPEIFENVEK